MNDYLLLIDGSSLLTTQFFGNLPTSILFAKTAEEKEQHFHQIMMTSKGVYTNAVFGFLRTLFKILECQKPKYVAVAWDLSRETFRREIDPTYKGNRDETLVPLKEQFQTCQEILKKIGIPQYMDKNFEADDFCGSLAKKFEDKIPVRIMTKDHDYLQLVTDKTHLWMMQTKQEKADELFKKYQLNKEDFNIPDSAFELTPELVLKEYGIEPFEVPALKGLQGDSSDNIKGVPGIGPKTAVSLAHHYHRVDALFDEIRHLDKKKEEELKKFYKDTLGISRSPIGTLLKTFDDGKTGEELAKLSELLATIKTDIDLSSVELSDLIPQIQKTDVDNVLKELEIKKLTSDFVSKYFSDMGGCGIENKIVAKDSFKILSDSADIDRVVAAFSQEKTIGIYYDEVSLYFSNGVESYGVTPSLFVTENELKDIVLKLKKSKAELYTYEGKRIVKLANEIISDVKIQSYLLKSTEGNYPIEKIFMSYPEQKYVFSFDGPFDSGCSIAMGACLLGPLFDEKLSSLGMEKLYREIELPLMAVLAHMEETGIQVDSSALEKLKDSFKHELNKLEKEIYELAGEEFNIQSPKQLGVILFEKLKIPYEKRKKGTGSYSTAAEILEKLSPDYPIVSKVLEYRMYAKLLGTYAEGLQNYIGPDSRIHGKFHQTVTATGRISSSDPNLQNIPVRLELGREIRKVFIPKEGCVFIDADYSQIELRILAHLSGDENLIQAYRNADDIHTWTASRAFKVPMDQVTPKMRRDAKAINFGIIYGISSFSLSEDLGITMREAEEYIRQYFETYPGVEKYLNGVVAFAKENDYVKTLYGRIREVPELKSQNFHQRSFGERVAMNSPIQGTASDIMKIAMIRTEKALRDHQMKTRIVLQIHDELILEAPMDEKEMAQKILKESMENAAELKVHLDVDCKVGNSWYETK